MKRAAGIATNQLHSDTETVTNDLSILRKPIKTSVNGFNEAKKAFENGTEEVRKLLSNECDIIYECKVCRSMFRSLANFISHKRVYCKSTFCSSLHHDFYNDNQGFSQDITTIVHSEENFLNGTVKNSKTNEKDLSSIVERLIKREKSSRLMKLSDFYEQVNNKLTKDEFLRKRHVLHLDVVPESNVAVYQTMKSHDNDGDKIKTEIVEIQDISAKSCIVLGPDGKVVSPSDLPQFSNEDDKLQRPFECEICNTKFATENTLKLHIEMKHITSTYVFQCPSCSKTFLQMGMVIRHLTNDHKKSMRRVRLMRDSIWKRRTRIDEVQVKGPSRELARLQTDKERVDSQNKAWLDNLDNENTCKNICLYCGRQFERRAVLLSHHKVCQQKKKPNTRISLTRKVDHDQKPTTNGWNDRENDESSNSNSLDGACMDDNANSAIREKSSKFIKSDIDNVSSENISTNRRKRNRALKAIIADDAIQLEDKKLLNLCWNSDENIQIKEEMNVSPIDDINISDSGSNQTYDSQPPTIFVKEEKRTRASASENRTVSVLESRAKSKLSSSHCKYCFKKFSNPSNLRRHITMSHFGPKKFTCNLCTFRARRKIDIISHVRTKHQFGGERSDAFKFITINDDPAPKPTAPSSSVNRRKEKHTEVLRDDEEEIFIDSESFIVNENKSEQVLVLGTSNENSNADLDDNSNMPTNDPVGQAETNKTSNSSKRKGRPKTRDKPKNVARSVSPADQKRDESLPARRPIRNRIMPVKKDFVYDLSTLLKKDYKDFQDEIQKQSLSQPEQPQSPETQVKSRNASPTPCDNKSSKRRQTLPNTTDCHENKEKPNNEQAKEEELQKQQPSQQQQNLENLCNQKESDVNGIKGAADAMAVQAVQANRAVFFKPPELPIERPLTVPQRQFELNTMKDWPILKRPPTIYDNIKSKLASPKILGLKRKKRSCLLKHSSNVNYKNRLNEKRMNGNTENRYKCKDLEDQTQGTMKISSKLANKIKLKCEHIDTDNVNALTKPDERNPQATVSSTNSLLLPVSNTKKSPETVNTTPRRMTLLERLAENKTRKLNESLSRMTIANSDNDTDED